MTGAASTYPILLWLAVIAQCFTFSMFSVFGKRGGLIGFAGLLLMTLTMHSPLAPHEVLLHSAATLGGALFYLGWSLAFSRLFWLREERQAMSVALFATADYMAARASFYDENADLDDAYRTLIQRQSAMTEKHQAARDMVLRALPRGGGFSRRRPGHAVEHVRRHAAAARYAGRHPYRLRLAAPHTLAGHDALVFMRDALVKMSLELNRVASGRLRAATRRNTASSAKAELRAIEYEIEQLGQRGRVSANRMLALTVQVLRRLQQRRAHRR